MFEKEVRIVLLNNREHVTVHLINGKRISISPTCLCLPQVSPGEQIIEQGDDGDNFYVIDK